MDHGVRGFILLALLILPCAHCTTAAPHRDREQPYDVVISGGTSAAVMAAIQTRRMGKSVIIVCPETHLGGLSASGLGWTDSGNKAVIGGLSREFYRRLKLHYEQPSR